MGCIYAGNVLGKLQQELVLKNTNEEKMLNDPLANALSCIQNSEKNGEKECLVKPISKIIKKVLIIIKNENYIEDFKIINEGKGGIIKVSLFGNINNCCAIKPRYNVKRINFEKFEKRYLPAKDFGIIIVSTSKGIMTHKESKEKNIGGRLLAYCY